MVSYDVREIRNSLTTVVGAVDPKRQEPVIAAFICTHHAGVLGFDLPKNIRAVPVHCTSRIDILDLLKAVETGVDGVAVVSCNDGTCKYKDIAPRVNARVRRGQEMLGMLGIGSGRIELLSVSSAAGGNPYAAACADFSGRISQMGLRNAKT
jgi:coenzyme F420-reducing hydrogenase delta subunit